MAQKVQITLLCDLDDGNVEAEETLNFSLADTTYEVDVCGKHASQIRDGLQPFVAHGRKAAPASNGNSGRRRPGRSAAGRDQTVGIRAWAKDKGIHVNDRGRIPASVVREYEAAH
ncbi:MAG: histone-like nucleoid-structuring protein Lsr2 [Streptosporangiaceae bacterium]